MTNHLHPAPTTDWSTDLSADHLLAVVEPAGTGDTALDLASDVVARGGRATVVLLITARVEDDIRRFAASENLDYSMAERHAIERLTTYCSDRIGAEVPTHVEWVDDGHEIDIHRHLADHITAVALPTSLPVRHPGRLATSLHRPVVFMPDRAA